MRTRMSISRCCCGPVLWRVTVAYVTDKVTYHEEVTTGTSNGFEHFMQFAVSLDPLFTIPVRLFRVSGNEWKINFGISPYAFFTHDFSTGQSPDILTGTPTLCSPTQAVITIQLDSLARADDFTWMPRVHPATLTAYRRRVFTRISGSSFLVSRIGPMTLTHSSDATYDYWTGEYAQPHDGATPVYLNLRCDKNGSNFSYQLTPGGTWFTSLGFVRSLKPFYFEILGDTPGNSIDAIVYDPADLYPYELYRFISIEIEGVSLEATDMFNSKGDSSAYLGGSTFGKFSDRSLAWTCLEGESIFNTAAIEAAIAAHYGVTGVTSGNQSLQAGVIENDTELYFYYYGGFTSSGGFHAVYGYQTTTASDGAFSEVLTLFEHGAFLDTEIGATITFAGEFFNASNPRECSPTVLSIPRLSYPTDYVNIAGDELAATDWTIYLGYSFFIEPTFIGQGTPPYTIALIDGTLPGGVSHNTSDGSFSGPVQTIVDSGTATFSITDDSGSTSNTVAYVWEIAPAPPTLTITYENPFSEGAYPVIDDSQWALERSVTSIILCTITGGTPPYTVVATSPIPGVPIGTYGVDPITGNLTCIMESSDWGKYGVFTAQVTDDDGTVANTPDDLYVWWCVNNVGDLPTAINYPNNYASGTATANPSYDWTLQKGVAYSIAAIISNALTPYTVLEETGATPGTGSVATNGLVSGTVALGDSGTGTLLVSLDHPGGFELSREYTWIIVD